MDNVIKKLKCFASAQYVGIMAVVVAALTVLYGALSASLGYSIQKGVVTSFLSIVALIVLAVMGFKRIAKGIPIVFIVYGALEFVGRMIVIGNYNHTFNAFDWFSIFYSIAIILIGVFMLAIKDEKTKIIAICIAGAAAVFMAFCLLITDVVYIIIINVQNIMYMGTTFANIVTWVFGLFCDIAIMLLAAAVAIYGLNYSDAVKIYEEEQKNKTAQTNATAQTHNTSQTNTYTVNNGKVYMEEIPPGYGYISIALHIILLFITCGIYQYVWVYRATKYTNRLQNEEYRDPVCKLLLCIFVPFYIYYWIYKTANRADIMGQKYGIQSESAIISLILAILCLPFVSFIIIQSKLNQVALKEKEEMRGVINPGTPINNGPASNPQPQTAQPNHQAQSDVIVTPPPAKEESAPEKSDREKLAEYKKMLDEGLITEEDYEKKKKEILGF